MGGGVNPSVNRLGARSGLGRGFGGPALVFGEGRNTDRKKEKCEFEGDRRGWRGGSDMNHHGEACGGSGYSRVSTKKVYTFW